MEAIMIEFYPNNVNMEHGFCLRKIKKLLISYLMKKQTRGLSPQANYADRATAACRPS
jgi:hypothetical protein